MSQQNLQSYSIEEVSAHINDETGLWVIIGEKVYDLTKFASLHPGGKAVIKEYAGKDATNEFLEFHSPQILQKYDKFAIGLVPSKVQQNQKNEVSKIQKMDTTGIFYGDGVPFGDPSAFQGYKSPYYTKNHLKFRDACRKFVQTHIEPYLDQWEEQRKTPVELIKVLGQEGVVSLCIGFPFWFERFGSQKVLGVELEKPDSFHELIFYDEFSKTGSGGILWGLLGMPMFGLPPILKYGSKELQERIGTPCLKGEKIICLAITEPWAGSDVAALKTSAVRSECGNFFIVNGMKKFITNGVFCDYFTTAVVTEKGMTMLVIPRLEKGVKTRKQNMTGMWSSGTSFVIFEDVKVPINNIIGKEGNGFKQTLENFNHERFMFLAQSTRLARVCYEESIKYAHNRKTFNKQLIEHPVIRQKLGNMLKMIESTQAWTEQIAYNMDRMNHEQKIKILSGVVAMGKVQASKTLEYCASEAIQILGGRAYTRGGQAGKIERIYREIKAMAIPGGSEEILLDLGVRNASKLHPKL